MTTVAELISDINSNNSRLVKESKLREFCLHHPLFILVLDRAYNPAYVYGIKKTPKLTQSGQLTLFDVWDQVEHLLKRLASRTVTGHAALAEVAVLMQRLLPQEAQVFENILKGDLRCGINVASINKVWPGTIPEYPYMRCSLRKGSNINKFDWTNGIFSQEKADGMFANVFVDEHQQVKITSRKGIVFANTEFSEFIEEFAKVANHGYCYNGELIVVEHDGSSWKRLPREIGNGVLNSVLKGGSFNKNQKPMYYMWDAIPIVHAVAGGTYKQHYQQRFAMCSQLQGDFFQPIECRQVFSLAEAFEHYVELTAQGKEGTVIKHPQAWWVDGTSKDQIKLKVEAEVDLIVRGFNPGNGRNEKYFGSIACESSDGLVQANVSGFTDQDRARITQEMNDWIDRKIITVQANSLMPDAGSGTRRLFLPRFVEERLDKTQADSLARIQDIFNEAMGL